MTNENQISIQKYERIVFKQPHQMQTGVYFLYALEFQTEKSKEKSVRM